MATTLRDSSLATRTARSELRARSKPYYRLVKPGLHLGYRKPLSGAGKWVIRYWVGHRTYVIASIAIADDYSDADGITVLNFKQAQNEAADYMPRGVPAALDKHEQSTVTDAIASYLEFLEQNHKSVRDARYRANAFILPKLGTLSVDALTTDMLDHWLTELAAAPAP